VLYATGAHVNWEALGAVGDLIGGLAVVVTLIYLALQVRQSKVLLERNEKIALSQVYQSRADARMNMHLAQAQTPGQNPSRIWGHPERVAELSDDERHVVRQFMQATYVHQDNMVFQASLGLLDGSALDGVILVVTVNVPVWLELDIQVSERVMDFYKTHTQQTGGV
jgi:hypothetical protein